MMQLKVVNEFNYISKPNGESHYVFNCPFCNKPIMLYCWNGHKNCECGAKHSIWLNGKYQLNSTKE